jgi:hypothetical protein
VSCALRGCQIFLGKNKPKCTKRPQNLPIGHKIPNGHEIIQMVIKYTKIFHSKALQNIPKLVLLV